MAPEPRSRSGECSATIDPQVRQAAADSPVQWRQWWWICLIAQVLFLPFVFLMAGRWSPKRAAADAAEHDRRVSAELAALGAGAEPGLAPDTGSSSAAGREPEASPPEPAAAE